MGTSPERAIALFLSAMTRRFGWKPWPSWLKRGYRVVILHWDEAKICQSELGDG